MIQKPTTDSTIKSIHKTRRETSDRFGGDIAAIAADAEQRAQKSDRPVWHPTTGKLPADGSPAA